MHPAPIPLRQLPDKPRPSAKPSSPRRVFRLPIHPRLVRHVCLHRMLLLPSLIVSIRLDCLFKIVVGLLEVDQRQLISIPSRQTQADGSDLCKSLALMQRCCTHSDTLHATIHLLTFAFLSSSSSPSTGRGLRLTPPL